MKKSRRLLIPFTLTLLSTVAIGLTDAKALASSVDYATKATVGFEPKEQVTPPVNPLDPGNPAQPIGPGGEKPAPGKPGLLTIDFVSSFDFGINPISNKDQTYLAQAQHYFNSELTTPNYAQVTDNRGTLQGWTLKVVENGQLKDETEPSSELRGAMISLLKPVTASVDGSPAPKAQEVIDLIPNQEAVVAVAHTGGGAGTWVVRWGEMSDLTSKEVEVKGKKETKTFTNSIKLFVPGKTRKNAHVYKSSMNWTLSDLPANQ